MASTPLHWDPEKMLQLYILDYMKRRGMDATAQIFMAEAGVIDAPAVIESREGFLHEWWSVLCDVYASRKNMKNEDFEQEARSDVAFQMANNGRGNLPPRIPQLSNQRPQPLQFDPTIDPSLQLINVNRQKFEDRGIGIQPRSNIPIEPLGKVQRGVYEGLNLLPQNGYPLNVDKLITSLLQAPNYRQQFQGLDTQNQQALAWTPWSQTSISLGNSSIYNGQDPRIPLVQTDFSKDKQNCMDEADGRPEDRNIMPLSDENEHADQSTCPSSVRKLIFATSDMKKDFSFEEVGCLHSSKSKVLSCHFSSDGKVLASAGHEKKAFVWNMETLDCVSTSDAHSLLITDVRFRPGSTIFATSSADKTVKIWDAAKASKSLFELAGHAEQVMSLDFHPRKADLLCSCDSNGIMRLWNINQGVCVRINRGGSKQVRFQPQIANLLAAAAGNIINVIDIVDDKLVYKLKGHVKDVISICWDVTGNFLASVSEDSARLWSVTSDGKCIQVLLSNRNKFHSCIFHPGYCNLLIIGCDQSLEFWIPTEGSKLWTHPAHKEVIAGLGASPENQMIASASHDHTVKLWK